MPKGTRVEKIYEAIKRRTGDKSLAAATAQKRTGQSLATGKKLRRKRGRG